jgi:hypothetical protein
VQDSNEAAAKLRNPSLPPVMIFLRYYRTQPSVVPAERLADDDTGPFHDDVLYDADEVFLDLLHVGHVAEPYDVAEDVRAVLELHVGQ